MRRHALLSDLPPVWLGIISLFLLPAPGFSQRIFGDLLGNVTDPSSAAVQGATVTLRNRDTGRALTTTSGPDGGYIFVEVVPGPYEVKVEHQGFETKLISNIRLSADQRVRVDVPLVVGAVATVVEVEASGGALVQTEASDLSEVVESRRVEALPVNGRSYLSLALSTPGVILGGSQGIKSNTSNFTVRNNQSIWVSGQRESSVNYMIDGIETRNNRWGSVSFRPSIDMISEFKIQRNAYGGEMGIDGGTVVNITTKNGTNQYHGTGFEFFRNNDLNARNFFDKGRAPFRDNNFGGVFGGPVVKNKVFFFASYEGDRSQLGQTLQGLFPSAAQMQGNLADDSTGTGIFPTNSSFCQGNPTSKQCKTIIDPSTGTPFPNNVIPISRISNFAQKYAQYLPAANALDRLPLGINRLVNPPISSKWNQWSARIDHNISSKDSVFYRFIWVNEPFFQPAINPGGGLNVPLQGRNFVAGWTRIISPQIVNTVHAGWNSGDWRRTAEFIDPNKGSTTNFSQVLGLANTSTGPFQWSVPGVSMVGYTFLGASFSALGDTDQNYQFNDTIIYNHGKHSMRFGGEFRREKYFGLSASGGPQFTFSGNYTGSSIGDYVLGFPSQASYSNGDGTGDFRLNLYALYASDSYKITPNLTMNIGMGWEYKSPPSEINNKMAIFDFSAQKYLIGGKDFHGSPLDGYYKSFKPQLGFAWKAPGSGNLVIRSGFGIYWESQKANDYEGLYLNAPFVYPATLTSGSTPSLSIDKLFPAIDPSGPIPLSVEIQTRFMHEKRPYSPEWNFTIQRQFADNWMVQATYEGSSLIRGGSFNQANPGTLDPTGTIPLQQRRLYPQFGDINLNTTMNHGYYHGGTASLKKRFSHGLSIDMNYTLARSIDNGTNEVTSSQTPLVGRKFDRGPSDIDIRHRYVATFIYELPVGKGRHFVNTGGVPDAVLGGWQISGITTFMTGPPDSVLMPGNWLNIGTRISARPNCVSDPNQSSFSDNVRSNGLVYFDTSAFQRPALYTPGNCGRNILRSPGVNNWDLSFQKTNRITERASLQTRFEFFNIWNHAQWQIWSGRSGGGYSFGQPGFGNATFGKVTAARDPRIIQLSMKIVF
jgi:hypothetical protein